MAIPNLSLRKGHQLHSLPPSTNWGLIIIFVNIYLSLIGVAQPVAETPNLLKIKHNQMNVQILDWTR